MLKILKRLPPVKTFFAIFFLLVQTGCALYLPYLTAGIVNNGILNGDIDYIWPQGGIMIAFSFLSLIGALLNMYISGKIAFRLGRDLRDQVFTKALRFSKREYDRFGISGLITRNINDVTQVQTVVEMCLKFLILCPLYLIGGVYLTWKLNPALALPAVTAIPFMAIAAVVIYRYATPLYSRMQKLLDQLNLLFREGVTGVRVIRAFAREESDYRKYEVTNRDYTKTSIKAGTIMSIFVPLITLLINLTTVGIIWIGGKSALNGSMEIGSIMAAISYSAQILLGFSLLTNVILTLPRGKVSVGRIFEVLDTPLAVEDVAAPKQPQGISLELDSVGLRYPGAAKPALSGVSLSVAQGQTLAIVGGTGDGKSTLLSLISRLYDTESGSVRLGDVNVRHTAQADLHQRVSYTPQKSSLMVGTIRSNLLLAKPDATDAEIWSALDAACASEFIRVLPDGLDSPVEKSGSNFSGGQRQRLCIARTILADADIYLFDDSFSALDFKTDAKVRAAIRKRLKNKITVIVAQRIGTVVDADQIAILEKGSLSGLGTHRQLSQDNPIYQEIIQSQGYTEVAVQSAESWVGRTQAQNPSGLR